MICLQDIIFKFENIKRKCRKRQEKPMLCQQSCINRLYLKMHCFLLMCTSHYAKCMLWFHFFACGISLPASFVHRFHLADTNENFTMAGDFLAKLARFSNDFSSEVGRNKTSILIRKLDFDFAWTYIVFKLFKISLKYEENNVKYFIVLYMCHSEICLDVYEIIKKKRDIYFIWYPISVAIQNFKDCNNLKCTLD